MNPYFSQALARERIKDWQRYAAEATRYQLAVRDRADSRVAAVSAVWRALPRRRQPDSIERMAA
jgi:hypothetical protein